jgi:hypothetical protein
MTGKAVPQDGSMPLKYEEMARLESKLLLTLFVFLFFTRGLGGARLLPLTPQQGAQKAYAGPRRPANHRDPPPRECHCRRRRRRHHRRRGSVGGGRGGGGGRLCRRRRGRVSRRRRGAGRGRKSEGSKRRRSRSGSGQCGCHGGSGGGELPALTGHIRAVHLWCGIVNVGPGKMCDASRRAGNLGT